MLINKDSRQNSDLLVLLKARTEEMKESVTDHFIKGHIKVPREIERNSDRRDYMYKWIHDNTEDHEIRVFDFLNDKLYSYRAKNELPG
jgi:hypothetical protein